jgi:hypothetical protein
MNKYYLCHHGIKGQRWGVRRFQNADGTLTAQGKQRYLTQKNVLKKISKTSFISSVGSAAGTLAAASRSVTSFDLIKTATGSVVGNYIPASKAAQAAVAILAPVSIAALGTATITAAGAAYVGYKLHKNLKNPIADTKEAKKARKDAEYDRGFLEAVPDSTLAKGGKHLNREYEEYLRNPSAYKNKHRR